MFKNVADDAIIKHLFTAGAFDYIIANNACISDAAGRCQAEAGSASAMTAAEMALVGGLAATKTGREWKKKIAGKD